MGKDEKNIMSSPKNSIEEIKKYYEEKLSVTLKNKYINEFSRLKLTKLEIESLIKIISSEDDSIKKEYDSLLPSILSIIALNHNESIVNQVTDLIKEYYEEKVAMLEEEVDVATKRLKENEKELREEHVDKLHPIISGKKSASLDENVDALLEYLYKKDIENFRMCPVYGRISAGQPNWAEECLEGYLPIDPNLMGIIAPEEHFFLRVNGESMNKVIRNGAYALIHKQDIVENGEIAIVLVNGDEATLKKFSKQEDLVILEPMSDDSSFQVQVYNQTTPINILGKYVGKFKINK